MTVSSICKSLITKLSPQLMSHFSFPLATAPATYKEISQGTSLREDFLDVMHPSWISPILRPLPENEVRLFLSCLNPRQSQKVGQIILFSEGPLPLTPLAKRFLRRTLMDRLAEGLPDLAPIECLPSSPLNPLVELREEQFAQLLGLLGIYDLALALPQIIETTKLKQIRQSLSKEQSAFLQKAQHQKHLIAFKKIDLSSWSGDPQALQALLHQRGVNRLAKALYGKDPQLVWYVSHLLDVEKGTLLAQLMTPLEHPEGATHLTGQITDLLSFIRGQAV